MLNLFLIRMETYFKLNHLSINTDITYKIINTFEIYLVSSSSKLVCFLFILNVTIATYIIFQRAIKIFEIQFKFPFLVNNVSDKEK